MAKWHKLFHPLKSKQEDPRIRELQEQLLAAKDELSRRERMDEFATRKINAVSDAYKLTARLFLLIVSVVGILFGLFLWRTGSEMTSEMEEMRINALSKLNQEIVRVETDTKRKIDEILETRRYTALLEEQVKLRLDLVVDPMIQSNVLIQIQPLERELATSLENLRTVINEVTNRLDFTLNSMFAQNGSRKDYGWLQRYAKDPTNVFRAEASAIVNRIEKEYRNEPIFYPFPIGIAKPTDIH